MIHEQLDILPLMTESAKITALVQSLVRKGLITEDGSKLTTIGIELLVFLDSKELKKIERKKTDTSKFEEWWKEFPGTNNFVHNGITFTGDRSLRTSKDDCRTKFDKILLEGEYTADELIAALKLHIHKMKKESIKTKINKLTYLHNSATYLSQRDFEPYIELIKQGDIEEEVQTTARITDI
jgi:ABC-type Fe3+/spermidine/putrescine transport system ATPase subunit